MAMIDKLTKEELLKALFGLIVESHDFYEGGYMRPEDKVSFDTLTVATVLKSLWNCTDPVPLKLFKKINRCGMEFKTQTYAGAVRAFYQCIDGGGWESDKKSCRNCAGADICPMDKAATVAVNGFRNEYFGPDLGPRSIRSQLSALMGGRCQLYRVKPDEE